MLITLHTKETLLNIGDGHGSYIHDFDLDSSGRIDVFYKGMQCTAAPGVDRDAQATADVYLRRAAPGPDLAARPGSPTTSVGGLGFRLFPG